MSKDARMNPGPSHYSPTREFGKDGLHVRETNHAYLFIDNNGK
jgi:hypothetical protein